MKKRFQSPPSFKAQGIIFYPAMTRHVPKFTSPLAPILDDIKALRANGCSILDLGSFVQGRTGWMPGERAIYRALARLNERPE